MKVWVLGTFRYMIFVMIYVFTYILDEKERCFKTYVSMYLKCQLRVVRSIDAPVHSILNIYI